MKLILLGNKNLWKYLTKEDIINSYHTMNPIEEIKKISDIKEKSNYLNMVKNGL